MRGLGGGHDLFLRGADLAVRDVVPDRARKQPRVLQHHAECLPHLAARYLAGVDLVDADAPGVDVVEPHQQVDDRRLACAGRSHDRDRLARPDLQAEVLDQRLVGLVAEVDVLERDLPSDLVEARARVSVGRLLLLLQQLEDPLRRGET